MYHCLLWLVAFASAADERIQYKTYVLRRNSLNIALTRILKKSVIIVSF